MKEVRLTKRESIKQRLVSDILSGHYSAGQRLAGERRLAAEMGASAGTVSLVLDELAREKLVIQRHRSGTYVKSTAIVANIPVDKPSKIVSKHLWGKLVEHAHRSSQKVTLKQIRRAGAGIKPRWEIHETVVRAFTAAEPVGFYQITMNDLPWLVKTGLCEDLTAKFHNWPQADNVYQVAIDAVTCGNKIYGLPVCGTLIGLAYHKKLFREIGTGRPETGSLDRFIRMVEKLAQAGEFKHSFWAGSARVLLMYLLRAFYDDLGQRFSSENSEPIQRDIGIEVLSILQRLKWKLGAIIPTALELSAPGSRFWDDLWSDFATGKIPMALVHLAPRAFYQGHGMSEQTELGFVPLTFAGQNCPFSLFNCAIMILNPRGDSLARDFLWSFLKEYIHPRSQYELDRRYVEEGQINCRSNLFITVPPRVPDDPEYQERRRELFKYAEPEIPFPSPTFDSFVFMAYKVLLDPDASVNHEYEFYLRMAQMGMRFSVDTMLAGLLEHTHRS